MSDYRPIVDPCRQCEAPAPHLSIPNGDYLEIVCRECRCLLERLPSVELRKRNIEALTLIR